MAALAGTTPCIFAWSDSALRPNRSIMVILVAILVVILFLIGGIPARQLAVDDGLPPGHQRTSSQNSETHLTVLAQAHTNSTRRRWRAGHTSAQQRAQTNSRTCPNQFSSGFVPGAVQVVTMGAESDSRSPSKLHDPVHVPHRARAHHCLHSGIGLHHGPRLSPLALTVPCTYTDTRQTHDRHTFCTHAHTRTHTHPRKRTQTHSHVYG